MNKNHSKFIIAKIEVIINNLGNMIHTNPKSVEEVDYSHESFFQKENKYLDNHDELSTYSLVTTFGCKAPYPQLFSEDSVDLDIFDAIKMYKEELPSFENSIPFMNKNFKLNQPQHSETDCSNIAKFGGKNYSHFSQSSFNSKIEENLHKFISESEGSSTQEQLSNSLKKRHNEVKTNLLK